MLYKQVADIWLASRISSIRGFLKYFLWSVMRSMEALTETCETNYRYFFYAKASGVSERARDGAHVAKEVKVYHKHYTVNFISRTSRFKSYSRINVTFSPMLKLKKNDIFKFHFFFWNLKIPRLLLWHRSNNIKTQNLLRNLKEIETSDWTIGIGLLVLTIDAINGNVSRRLKFSTGYSDLIWHHSFITSCFSHSV